MKLLKAKEKYEKLINSLSSLKSLAIGFSGGVDSTFLLHAAKEALGDNLLAITIDTPYVPRWEINEAVCHIEKVKVNHKLISLPFPEAIRKNPENRCYLCKKILFSKVIESAFEEGIVVIADGTNLDDMDDFRPGFKALQELGVASPLKDAGFTKNEIRWLSSEFGLDTAFKPAFACLMSRIPINTTIDEAIFKRIENAERFLMSLGFPSVRVRTHGDLARIEVEENKISDLLSKGSQIEENLKSFGYRYVTADMGGYRMGSLNH